MRQGKDISNFFPSLRRCQGHTAPPILTQRMSAAVEVTNHLIKARDLATLACQHDENGQLAQAIQHYDEAILFIDEVLGKIPATCDASQLLMIYRSKYNTRLV
jgi:hypothetical protein